MAENESNKLPSPLPLISSIAIISAAILIWHSQLESPRPSPPSGLEPAVLDAGAVDAALWQDPFEVALSHEREFHRGAKDSALTRLRSCSSDHCANLMGDGINQRIQDSAVWKDALAAQAADRNGPPWATAAQKDVRPARAADPNDPPAAVHILMVMVRDEWSAEDHERRLRSRYAVLAALGASGMKPEDTKHIQYWKLLPTEWKWSPEPLVFPFEWFEHEALYVTDRTRDDRPERLLVLWLPQSAFEKEPLRKIAWLLQRVGKYLPECNPSTDASTQRRLVRADLIGPPFSTVLGSMLGKIDEFKEKDSNAIEQLKKPPWGDGKWWLRIYSPWATASPALLVKKWSQYAISGGTSAAATSAATMLQVIPQCFAQAGIGFVPMIGTDDMLALGIIKELERRGVDVVSESDGDPIVLISEWDTFYGKAFPLTFAAMMHTLGGSKRPADRPRELDWNAYAKELAASLQQSHLPRNLYLYTYLTGIDGRLPEVPGQEAKTPSGSAEAPPKWTYSENLEVPVGQGQLDYARRLVRKLHDEFSGLGQPRLKAIGIVGSDVYDKLILLHALREEFGDTLLFTVDLDARLLDHEQLRWTRNVLVVSNYGLELNPPYYARISPPPPKRGDGRIAPLLRLPRFLRFSSPTYSPFPPFRENYQAALFLACRTALGLRQHSESDRPPRLRDLKPEPLARLLTNPRVFEVGRHGAVDLDMSRDRTGFHPLRPDLTSAKGPILPLLVVVVCLGLMRLLWTPLARGLCGIAPWACRDGEAVYDPGRHRVFRTVVFVALALFSGLVLYNHYAPHGERFSLTNGISVWPGLAVWLFAVLLGIHFAVQALRIVQESDRELARDFGLYTRRRKPLLSVDVRRLRNRGRLLGRNLLGLPQRWKTRWRQFDTEKVGPFARRALYGPPEDPPATPDRGTVKAQRLWTKYISSGRRHRRILRAALASAGLFLVILGLMWLYGLPFVPGRGPWSFGIYGFFGLLALVLLSLLLFFTIDAVRLCLRLINRLIADETIWPGDKARGPAHDPTDPTAGREGWMDVLFIARMTETQGRLLYLPAIVLLLVVAGRFWYFDNWGYPLQVLLVYAAIAVWLGVGAVGLTSAAKRARAATLDRLKETLRQVDDEARAERTEAMKAAKAEHTAALESLTKALREVGADVRADRIETLTAAKEEHAAAFDRLAEALRRVGPGARGDRIKALTAAKEEHAAAFDRLTEALRGIGPDVRADRIETLTAAGEEHAAALDRLKETVGRLEPGVRADRLKAMIEEIQSIKKGAFRPLAENAVVHFLLIPSGGAGLITLLTYLLPP